MPEIIVCDEHNQVYETWRERNQSGLKVSHVDFHCDMRGLLIDRPRKCAYFANSNDSTLRITDPGNYLGLSIMEGIVSSVNWIHDVFGGRRYDVGTVKYESDLSILPHRFLHRLRREREVPVVFNEYTFDQWSGGIDDHELDIDWDAFASINYEISYVRKLTKNFLDRDFSAIPKTTFVVYSPGYSHPDRTLYEEFIEALALKFSASVTRLPLPGVLPQADTRFYPRFKYKIVQGLHRLNIY